MLHPSILIYWRSLIYSTYVFSTYFSLCFVLPRTIPRLFLQQVSVIMLRCHGILNPFYTPFDLFLLINPNQFTLLSLSFHSHTFLNLNCYSLFFLLLTSSTSFLLCVVTFKVEVFLSSQPKALSLHQDYLQLIHARCYDFTRFSRTPRSPRSSRPPRTSPPRLSPKRPSTKTSR